MYDVRRRQHDHCRWTLDVNPKEIRREYGAYVIISDGNTVTIRCRVDNTGLHDGNTMNTRWIYDAMSIFDILSVFANPSFNSEPV